ncbi:probable pectinesterase/pectinesterase inhibitor 54 [Humulus lupulus]|uniref:probable pectinesterase/pectinesterase inhibitor 54 n=1 Tax=Humulus lupulus TaxID=3486 RepID=UPI002B40C906|nr:probable pectinesterase/pectinesterase inhibitor 54 [Humulus lupulus]
MIMMRMQEIILVFWALGICALGVAMDHNNFKSDPEKRHIIEEDCSLTRYPSICVQTLNMAGLSSSSGSYQYTDIISVLLNKTIYESKLPTTHSTMLTSHVGAESSAHQPMITTDECETLMSLSEKKLQQSLTALTNKNKVEDIQTWLSAAMTFQEACKDSDEGSQVVTNGVVVRSDIAKKMAYLYELSSNALALTNRIVTPGKTTSSSSFETVTRRLSEKDGGFPTWVSRKDRKLLQATTTVINADVVVAQDGSGNYKTVSEAIQAAPGSRRFVIHVKGGVYKEKIRTNKDGITLIGDGKYSSVIVWDDSVAGGTSMPATATFTVTGDGFIARDIGFHNTAGPHGKQALALHIASDRSALYRCSIAGYQDTLYALALRQFYRECDISGTVDFIFGNAAAVFQNCELSLRRPRGDNVILASGRSDPGQNTGFSVQNCRVTASAEFAPVKHSYESYLGRPWKAYSRAVVMQSNIDDAISPKGWVEWPGYGTSVLRTLYFAEYANVGPGARTGQRVNWPGFHLIGVSDAAKFTVANFIGGNSWLPSTKVTFNSGLQ